MLQRCWTRALALLVLLSATACGPARLGPDEEVDESEQALSACAPATTVLGIDISSYQHPNGAAIDWNAVAASRRFVIIKASEGTGYTNSYHADDSSQARSHGMLVGAYHFLRYTSSGAQQAQHFLASVGGGVAAGDLPPMLDVEDVNDAASPAQRTQIMKEWLDTVEAAIGRKPMIYSGSWYWGPYMGSPGGYAGVYPMVWAAYTGGSCPKIPDDFPGLLMWQYLGGGGTTPGIQGACDQDMFYGSEAELMALVDRPPVGWLDAAGCESISGWAQDPDSPGSAVDVHLYFGGPAGSGAPGAAFHASVHREDLCGAIGSCEHGYSVAPPFSLFDGKPHAIHAYGIDQAGGANAELSGSSKDLSCAPTLPTGVRRHVTDPTSFGAWKLDELWDTLPLGDAEIAKLDVGEDWPQAPQLVQADDGTPEVWLVDGKHRRHVPDPAAMSAWRLDWGAITTKPAAEVYANAEGPALRSRPTLLHEANGAIWLVDEPSAGDPAPSGSGGAGSSGGSGGKPGSTGGGKGISPSRELTEEAPNGCACSLPGERRQSAPTGVPFWALAVLAGAARSSLFRRRASSEPSLQPFESRLRIARRAAGRLSLGTREI